MPIPNRTTDAWRKLDAENIWHPFTQMRDWVRASPPIIERADGFHLIDTDGNRYIDGHSSLWVNVHGHGHPKITAAIAEQARNLDHSTLLGLGNTPSIEFAARLAERTPARLTRVFYSDSGSTAMEIALKIAYQYWQHRGERQRKRFITFSGAYHGDTIGSVSLGAIELFHDRFRPLLFESTAVPWPRPYRDPEHAGNPEAARQDSFAQLERTLDEYGDTVVAVSAECGVQGADGMHVAPAGFMQGVEALCRKYGVLFIVDEVATGFGRTGKLFGCETLDIEPDLMALAKGITGGTLPLAVTMTSESVYEAYLGEYDEFKTFFHGHTYTGNPIACAAAIASLELFDETGLLQELPSKCDRFSDLLAPLGELPHVGEIRRFGLMAGIELVADQTTKEVWPPGWKVPQRVVQAAAEKGAVVRPLGNVMILMPPPAIPESLLAELVEITKEAIAEVTANPDPGAHP